MFSTKSLTKQRQDDLRLLKYLNSKRKQGLFNDVTIKVNDKCFPANRLVLSCYSEFFETMFQTEMKEKYRNTIDMDAIDCKTMQIIIDYIYTGTITIDDENVFNLLSAADYLLMDELKQYCFEFLESNITSDNCLTIFDACFVLDNKGLLKKVYDQINNDFEASATKEEFKQLSKQKLVSCISNLDRSKDQEESIYNAIISWTNHDLETRKLEFIELFELLELNRLPLDFLINVALNEKLVEQNSFCMSCLKSALSEKIKNISIKEKEKKILSVGGSTMLSKVFDVYESASDIQTDYPDLPDKVECHCLLVSNNVVYVIGGEYTDDDNEVHCSDKVWQMDLNQTKLQWKSICAMSSHKTKMGAAVYKNTVVVAGGWNNNETRSSMVQVYLQSSDEWKLISRLNQARHENELVACDDGVFCLGGYDGENVLSSVEHLVDLKSKWNFVKPMLTPRKWFAAVNCKGTIYAIGGKSNDEDTDIRSVLKSVEKYKFNKDEWSYVCDMKVERHSHSACVLKDKIYVVGGFDKDNNTIKQIECYDSDLNKWSKVDEITHALFDHKTVAI